MMNFFANITKAAVAVAVTPVSLALDLVTAPLLLVDPDGSGVFDRTAETIGQASDAMNEALKPSKE